MKSEEDIKKKILFFEKELEHALSFHYERSVRVQIELLKWILS